jgi:phosphatidylserine decarboxylase
MAERNPAYIARDGWPFLAAALVLLAALWRFELYWWLPAGLALLGLLVALFRDPPRSVPANPAAAVSPVDGRVLEVGVVPSGVLDREALCIRIRVNNLGAYSLRSPIEGGIRDLRPEDLSASARSQGLRGLWVRGDEGNDAVVLVRNVRLFGSPKAFCRYGERVGQGARVAFLRVALEARLYLPKSARPECAAGDRVEAGVDVLATLVRR